MGYSKHFYLFLAASCFLVPSAKGAIPDLSGLPLCAVECIPGRCYFRALANSELQKRNAALQYLAEHSNNCEVADFTCQCDDNELVKALPGIFRDACAPQDRKHACSWAVSECRKVGVTISPLCHGPPAIITVAPDPASEASTSSVHVPTNVHSPVSETNQPSPTNASWARPSLNSVSKSIATAEPSKATTASLYPTVTINSGGNGQGTPANSTTTGPLTAGSSGNKKAGSPKLNGAMVSVLFILVTVLLS